MFKKGCTTFKNSCNVYKNRIKMFKNRFKIFKNRCKIFKNRCKIFKNRGNIIKITKNVDEILELQLLYLKLNRKIYIKDQFQSINNANEGNINGLKNQMFNNKFNFKKRIIMKKQF